MFVLKSVLKKSGRKDTTKILNKNFAHSKKSITFAAQILRNL
jgi:hypothetical protein